MLLEFGVLSPREWSRLHCLVHIISRRQLSTLLLLRNEVLVLHVLLLVFAGDDLGVWLAVHASHELVLAVLPLQDVARCLLVFAHLIVINLYLINNNY